MQIMLKRSGNSFNLEAFYIEAYIVLLYLSSKFTDLFMICFITFISLGRT